jgi:alpha-beta hydrolase superfamily lysophospholipase
MDHTGLPLIESYSARDATSLSFRTYAGGQKQVIVLIHGSAGSSVDMHAMAKALHESGSTVYVPDLRGHGANQPHGDVAYIGQLDDDMADFLRVVQPRHSGAKWVLLGFSSGGGFVLRIAGGPLGPSFDRYVLLSPFLRYDAPTIRTAQASSGGQSATGAQAWTTAAVPRMFGLVALNAAGIHAFDGLPVIYFAVPPDIPLVTSSYSWRLQSSFQPHEDFMADIRAVSKPMQVFVGEKDELFAAEKFESVFDAERKDIPVTILPGLSHTDMVTNSLAIRAIVAALQ